MYGPPIYYGPPELPIGTCECGQSEEDCGGDCYQYGLLQLTDPATGEHPLPLGSEHADDDPRINVIEVERARWGR